jgi:hypothetical protein
MTKSQELLKQASQKIQGVEDGIDCYIFNEAEIKSFAEAVIEEWEKDHKRPKEMTGTMYYDADLHKSHGETRIEQFTTKLFEKEEDNDGKDGEKLTR